MFSEVAEIAFVAARLGQFQQLLKTRVILILNFTRPHAITYTKQQRHESEGSWSERGTSSSEGRARRRTNQLSFHRLKSKSTSYETTMIIEHDELSWQIKLNVYVYFVFDNIVFNFRKEIRNALLI